jgi:hypothetical protein
MRGCKSFTIVCATLFLAAATTAADDQPAPPFRGQGLPTPPAQDRPWTPPQSNLAAPIVSATQELFRAGLADPRGCEYREISLRTGNCWSGDSGIAKTHGWVLPATDDPQRFAVCWNGLVYPVAAVGAKADLRASVLAATKTENERVDRDEKVNQRSSRLLFYVTSEGQMIAHDQIYPLRTCLLLRLGEGGLAETMWTTWARGVQEDTNDHRIHLKDPYLLLATDWAWALFDRAICAHMRADDGLALVSARALVPMELAVEKTAAAREFKRQTTMAGAPRPYLTFLGELPRFLEDQERRAKVEKSPEPAGASARERRIAGLIRDLENVSARQRSQPGWVDVGWDDVVDKLVAEGEAAVEPLIDCLENDRRLTRSVGFGRNFFPDRSVIGVSVAARRALERILKTSNFGDNTDLPKPAAELIRGYWNKFKGVQLAERWYAVLADDKASRKSWLEAARDITRAAPAPARDAGERPRLQGEALRFKKGPSVTELLIKRIDAMCQVGRGSSEQTWALSDASQLTEHLAKWDRPASPAVLKDVMKACRLHLDEARSLGSNIYLMGIAVARCASLRNEAGDRQGLDDYADWVRTADPTKLKDSWREMIQPMWQNPDHPAIAAAARAMFVDPQSRWKEPFLRTYATKDLLSTPLIGVPAVQERLLTELIDTAGAGVFKMRSEHSASLLLTGGLQTGFSYSVTDDPLAPPLPAEVSFRVCDYYAWRLARLDLGAPRCELYWPEAARDKAVAECVAYLKKYGERLKHVPSQKPREDTFRHPMAQLSFPELKRPATPQDVQRGTAIFSLDGDSSARVGSLPEHPMKARWTALKDYPYHVQFYNPTTGESGWRKAYNQDGFVWQVEEIDKDGARRRYYGFVGSHRIAKVPAEEIELPLPRDAWWAELTNGIDCRVDLEPSDGKDRSVRELRETGYQKLVQVQLRNRSGLDRKLPATLARKEGKVTVLHAGIEPRLWYAPPKTLPDRADANADWQELKVQPFAQFVSPLGSETAAGAAFGGFTFNLVPLFDLTKAGRYRLRVRFTPDGGGFAAGESNDVYFSLDAK